MKIGNFEFSTFEIGYIAWCIGFGVYLIVTNWPVFLDDKVGFYTTGEMLVFFAGVMVLSMGGGMLIGKVVAQIELGRQYRRRSQREYYMGR